MQLNKVLKGLMLALPVIAVAACSSHKTTTTTRPTVWALMVLTAAAMA